LRNIYLFLIVINLVCHSIFYLSWLIDGAGDADISITPTVPDSIHPAGGFGQADDSVNGYGTTLWPAAVAVLLVGCEMSSTEALAFLVSCEPQRKKE
jgi:hypothetical protein